MYVVFKLKIVKTAVGWPEHSPLYMFGADNLYETICHLTVQHPFSNGNEL